MVTLTLQGNRQLTAKVGHLSGAILERGARALGTIGERLATYGRTHFPDNGLHVRSGDLRRSMNAMPVEKTLHGLRGGMLASQGLPYGPIQEFGGIIKPVNGTYLTIPLDEAVTSAGVARFSAPEAEAAGYKTFVRGRVIYGIKDGILYPLFALVTQVVIPARPFVGPTLAANKAFIENTLKKAVDEAIKESH